ncbi:unnamed protein product [Meganyctiphanes norvegica]|uniref:Arrestin C-terminal-like domain-containing protein n=1 Tax=Meganyctiphanes norvegica TaxID=48144 RepID=A0AAV2QMR6_MEGNR
MAPNINVLWDNSSMLYFPGQPITGRVQVNSVEIIYAKAIKLEFKGFCKVHWTEEKTEEVGTGENRRQKTRTEHYNNYEEYYKERCCIWQDNTNYNQLPAGTHTFKFDFDIPDNSPSSFRSEHGKVQHELEVKIEVPNGEDIKKIVPYSVNDVYDLNRDQNSLLPIEKNKHKTVCCLCCRSGPISLVLRVPRIGYVPGEEIIINAECTNMSRRLVKKSKIEIKQKVIHHADDGSTKDISRVIAEKKRPKIDAGDSDIWSGERLLVPAVPPSHLQHCKHIVISYFLTFSLDIADTLCDLSTTSPIIIGTIPLQQNFSNFSPTPALPQVLPNAPPVGLSRPTPEPNNIRKLVPGLLTKPKPVSHMPVQPIPSAYNPNSSAWSRIPENSEISPSAPLLPEMQDYPNIPPPTYSHCAFGLKKHDDDADDFDYVPRYVSYDLHNRQQTAADNN